MVDASIAGLEEDAKEGKRRMEALVDVFLRGDAEGVAKMLADAGAAGDEEVKKFLEALVYKRNEVMVERLLERAKGRADKTIFLAVGAAHFPGERGILDLLAKKGLKARRVAPDEKIPPRKAPTPAPAGAGGGATAPAK
jgi:uncharacterized protein YbaP (TraB family)